MSIYLNLIKEQCLPNKYTKWYINICLNAQSRVESSNFSAARMESNLITYSEGHHILPRCLCKKAQIDDFDNYAFLTAKEHCICHLLLCKMFNCSKIYKMQRALSSMVHLDPSLNKDRYKSNFVSAYITKRDYTVSRIFQSKYEIKLIELENELNDEHLKSKRKIKKKKIKDIIRQIETLTLEIETKYIRKYKGRNFILAVNIDSGDTAYVTFDDMISNKALRAFK